MVVLSGSDSERQPGRSDHGESKAADDLVHEFMRKLREKVREARNSEGAISIPVRDLNNLIDQLTLAPRGEYFYEEDEIRGLSGEEIRDLVIGRINDCLDQVLRSGEEADAFNALVEELKSFANTLGTGEGETDDSAE